MSGLVAAIIVSCNGINSIGTCLESLVKSTYPNYKIVVVDNGSTDGLNGFVKTYFPDVILISFQKNMGAAGGRNRALKVCEQFDPSYIYCIDDDAKIEADAVTCLINFIENNPKCGFAGSRIMNLDNPKEPHALGAVFDGEKLSVRHLSQAAMDSAYEVDLVSTCSVAFRYNVIKEIGQLDEGFWVYHEDVDWALLAIEKGYKNYIVPSSIAYHKLSSSKYNPRAIYFLTRNIFLLGIKHGYLKSKWDKKVFNQDRKSVV